MHGPALRDNCPLQYNKLLAYMRTTYNMGQVCLNEGPCMPLEPGEHPNPVPAQPQSLKHLLGALQLPSSSLLQLCSLVEGLESA